MDKNTTETPQDDQASENAEEATAAAKAHAEEHPPVSDFFAVQEATATGETYIPTEEEIRQRKKRSLAIAGGLVVFIVLVFVITILKLSALSNGAGA